jgi:hypothetical protein
MIRKALYHTYHFTQWALKVGETKPRVEWPNY